MGLKKNIGILLTSLVLFSACASKDAVVEKYQFKTDTTGLKLQSSSPTLIFVRPNAKEISSYSQFMIAPIKVDYNDPSVRKLSGKQIKKLQEYFHNSLVKKFKEQKITITNSLKPNTMKISFIISGIKAPSASANIVSIVAPIALSVGEVTVEASFINTDTNSIDAVVVNKSQGSKVLNTTPWSTWADIESSFDQWAEGIANSISN